MSGDNSLKEKNWNDNGDKDVTLEYSFENIKFVFQLSGVEEIGQLHHDKKSENKSIVSTRIFSSQFSGVVFSSTVDKIKSTRSNCIVFRIVVFQIQAPVSFNSIYFNFFICSSLLSNKFIEIIWVFWDPIFTCEADDDENDELKNGLP